MTKNDIDRRIEYLCNQEIFNDELIQLMELRDSLEYDELQVIEGNDRDDYHEVGWDELKSEYKLRVGLQTDDYIEFKTIQDALVDNNYPEEDTNKFIDELINEASKDIELYVAPYDSRGYICSSEPREVDCFDDLRGVTDNELSKLMQEWSSKQYKFIIK